MNQASYFSSHIDPESQRKRALASVYELLLKLAEEKKNIADPETLVNENDSAPLKSNNPSQGV